MAGGCCFIAGVKVTLFDGSEKNIEDVEVGDALLGSDGAKNIVIELIRPELGNRQLLGFNLGKKFFTHEHPFMTSQGWKSFNPHATLEEEHTADLDTIGRLRPGAYLERLSPVYEFIESIDAIDADRETPLYNFTLTGNHTYYADGYLVHNKGGRMMFGGGNRTKDLANNVSFSQNDLDRAVQQSIEASIAGGKKFLSKDPFIRAGQISADAIKEGTDVNLKAMQDAIAGLESRFGEAQGFLDPFNQAGLDALSTGAGGAQTVAGLDQRINEILGSDSFGRLVDERMQGITNILASGGLRSGDALNAGAAIPLDVAFQIENQLFNRNQQNINRGFGAATGLGDFTTNLAQQIAALTGQTGAINQAGIQGAADARANALLAKAQQDQLNSNSRRSSKSNFLGTVIGGALSGAFSDPLLKKNVRPIAKIGPLIMFQWEWIDRVKGTIMDAFPTAGFMSTQVREYYPEFVSKFDGYDVVDYDGLTEVLLNGR